MPARKRGKEGKKSRSWTMMLREDVRTSEEARIRRDFPDVAKALDFMASRYEVYKDGYGWTVFTDWILKFHPKAVRNWPEDIPRLNERELYGAVFLKL